MRLSTLQNLQANSDKELSFLGKRGEVLRLDVLEEDIIRLRMLPEQKSRLDRTWLVLGENGDAPLEGRSRDDLSPFSLPSYQKTSNADETIIETEALRLIIKHRSAHLIWQSKTGETIASDLPHRAYTYDRAGRRIYHYLQRREDEHYYGFGERSGALDKYGRRMRMLNVDALGYNAETSDPLYKHIPFYISYIPSLKIAYGLFYDNLSTTSFDMGQEIDAFWGNYRSYEADDGDLDYYFIYGASIPEVLEKYCRLTGKAAMLPRYAFGYLGSTMKYTEAPDAQAQLKRFVELCEEHQIPCDLFHLSSGYTTDGTGRRFVFTWNRNRVPSPETMVQTFHDAGIRLAPNIKPYLLTDHPAYEIVKAAGGFVTDPDTGEPALCRFWSGGAYESGEGAYIDFSSQAGFDWWKNSAKAALLELGIDGLWNDNNEFELWDDDAICAGFGQAIRMGMIRPLHTLLMARSSYQASLETYPNRRPFILSRAACAGMQRYVQSWSGDNETSWHTLKYNIPMGLGMSLSGMPHTGHDVGGFFGAAPEPELFIRWIQSGIFHPRFTIHSWNTDGTVNEPWMYPEILPIVRELIEFRYRLIPYLYLLSAEAHETGAPLMRPLVYHFPDDPHCWTESFNYLLGSHLLVASVTQAGETSKEIYLPAGTKWANFYTGEWVEGGQTIRVDAPLERIPLMVRDGGMIPLGGLMRYVGERADDWREIHVFVADENAEIILYDDDGETFAYQNGDYSRLKISLMLENGVWQARLEHLHNGYPLSYKNIKLIIRNGSSYPVAGAENGILTLAL
jgi:alpha-glucosidase